MLNKKIKNKKLNYQRLVIPSIFLCLVLPPEVWARKEATD